MAVMLLSEYDGNLPPMHPSWYAPLNTLDMSKMPAKFEFRNLAAATNGRALMIKDYPVAGQNLTIRTRNLAIDTTHRQALYNLYPVLQTGIQNTPDPVITPVPVSPPVPWPTVFP